MRFHHLSHMLSQYIKHACATMHAYLVADMHEHLVRLEVSFLSDSLSTALLWNI